MKKKLLAVFGLLMSLSLFAACGGGETSESTGGTSTGGGVTSESTGGESTGGDEECEHTGGTATCTEKAVCDECGEEYGELAAHDYSVLQSDDDSHWYKCANCDATDGDAAHVAGTEVKYDATNHWNECECGYKMNVTAHTIVGGSDAEKHWGECDCDYASDGEAHVYSIAKSDENNHWNECACGAKSGEAAHSYTEAKHDDTNHWNECSCGAKADEEAHVAGTEVKSDDANHWVECECGYAMNVTAHAAQGEWVTDENNHWKLCECGVKVDEAAHNGGTASCTEKAACADCGKAYGDLAEHDHTAKNGYYAVSEVKSGKYVLVAADLYMADRLGSSKTYGYLYSDENALPTEGYYATVEESNVFTITKVDGGYTIQDSYGRYLYNTGTYNNFSLASSDSSVVEDYLWTIAINADGTATIKDVTTSKTIMQGESTFTSYGVYADGTAATLPVLYAYENNLESDETGHWYTCNVCGNAGEKADHAVAGDAWEHDEDSHWQVCVCGAVVNEAAHSANGEWVVESGKDVMYCDCGQLMDYVTTANAKVTRVNLNLETADATSSTTFSLLDVLDEAVFEELGKKGYDFGSFYFNGKVMNVAADQMLAIPASEFGYAYGEQIMELGVVTADKAEHKIQIQLFLITNVIETKEELDNFNAVAALCEADEGTQGGYFELGADIVYNSEIQIYKGGVNNVYTPANYGDCSSDANKEAFLAKTGFVGTFDGCGYAIDGLFIDSSNNNSVGAFITKLGEGGVIKNVSFSNAVFSGASSLITAYNDGTVENVYAHVFSYGGWIQSGGTGLFTTFNSGWLANSTAIISGATWGSKGSVSNLFVDMSDSAIVNTQDGSTSSNYGKTWHDDENVADTTNNRIMLLGKVADVEYNGVYVIGIPENLTSLTSGLEEDVDLLAGYVDASAWAAAYNAENSAIAAEIATWPTWLAIMVKPADATLTEASYVNLNVNYANSAVSVNTTATGVIDLSEIGDDLGELVSVSYKGTRIAGATLSGTELTVPVAAFGLDYGESNVTVITESGKYIVPVILVTKVLTTAEEVQNFGYIAMAIGSGNKIQSGYFTLGNDIDFSTYNNGVYIPYLQRNQFNPSWGSPAAIGFNGVFDGRGYTISNMTVGDGTTNSNASGFIPVLHVDGVIRNVGFANASANMAGLFGIVTSVSGGLMENIYVSLNWTKNNGIGVLFRTDNVAGRDNVTPVVKDVFVDISAGTYGDAKSSLSATGQVFALGGSTSSEAFGKFEGAYALLAGEVNNKSKIAGVGGAVDGSVYDGYESADSFKADEAAQAEMATWNTSYWTITDGVPVWNTAK